jgi:hypothetical protein
MLACLLACLQWLRDLSILGAWKRSLFSLRTCRLNLGPGICSETSAFYQFSRQSAHPKNRVKLWLYKNPIKMKNLKIPSNLIMLVQGT